MKTLSKKVWQKKSRRKFMTAGLLSALGIGFGRFLLNRDEVDEIPGPLRAMLRFNEEISKAFFKSERLGESPPTPPVGQKPRVNGKAGIETALAEEDPWKLILSPYQQVLSLDDLKAMPQTECTANFKCIEGWSQDISYKGVRFSDFLAATKTGLDAELNPYPYVGLETPDEEYYVSIDRSSMMHPKTVLATEMNGMPLSEGNGAPLRLVIPVKYGIKNLKRIGKITFAHERLPDYWAERGYDWYSGL